MRRAGRLLIAVAGIAAFVAIGDVGADARPHLGAVFGLLRAPFGVFGRLAHLRHRPPAYRHRSARRVIAGARHRAAVRAAGPGAAALAYRASWSGPVFWPAAYDDMFGYVTSPADMRFWSGGFADVLAGIFGSPGSKERESALPRSRAVRTASADDRTTGAAPATSEQKPCGTLTAQSVDDLIAHISETVRPNAAQQAALKDLRAAMTRAAADLRGACPQATPLTPLARLGAMQQRLWAMQSAALLVRAPFAKLVASLDDQQKARLDDGPPAMPAPRADLRRHSRRTAEAATGAPVQICYMQSRAAAPPTEEIAERVRPSEEQQAGLKALAETSGNMTRLLLASCPDKRPASALARFDAVLGRLEAMLYVINVVNPPLQDFYGSLSDEQKARFNSLGAAASAS